MKNLSRVLVASLLLLLLVGCANEQKDRVDPFENYNRAAYGMGYALDKVTLKPIATVYSRITPPPLKTGITNAFNNALSPTTIINDALQGRFKFFFYDVWRTIVNSTVGIGGLFDVAAKLGAPAHQEDFGLTFAYWGAKQSVYFVIPIAGFPSTFRDMVTMPFDIFTQPLYYLKPAWLQYSLYALYFINGRSKLLDADQFIDTSFDQYVFVRNAYLQMRNKKIKENELPFKQWLTEKRGEDTLSDPSTGEQFVANADNTTASSDQLLPDNPAS